MVASSCIAVFPKPTCTQGRMYFVCSISVLPSVENDHTKMSEWDIQNMRNIYTVLVGKLEVNELFEKFRCRLEDNKVIDLCAQ